MKTSLAVTIATLALPLSSGNATMPVIDAAHIASDQIHQTMNYVQYVASQLNTYATQVNTYANQINTYKSLIQSGNPSSILSLAGLSGVSNLYRSTMNLYGSAQGLYNVANPNNLTADIQAVGNQWNTFSAQQFLNSGYSPNSLIRYRFDQELYASTDRYKSMLDELNQKRTSLIQKRSQLTKDMQAATTHAEIEKQQAAITGINGMIADVDSELRNIAERAELDKTRVQASRQISDQALADIHAQESAKGLHDFANNPNATTILRTDESYLVGEGK